MTATELSQRKQFLYVTRIALGTVVDEHLVAVEMDAARHKVVAKDGIAQEVVTVLRTVASERRLDGHLVDGLVHGLDDGRTERARHVANAETDDARLRMQCLVCVYPLGYVDEQVASGQFQIMLIYQCHIYIPFYWL